MTAKGVGARDGRIEQKGLMDMDNSMVIPGGGGGIGGTRELNGNRKNTITNLFKKILCI